MRPTVFSGLLCFILLYTGFCPQDALGQTMTVKGTVYNMTRTKPMQSVSVMSTSGRGTVTDSNGHYSINVSDQDSISFSYLGRETYKYPVKNISAYNDFDIALHVEPTELRTVRVAPRNYHIDSLQNRKDYARYFDYHKPGLKLTEPGSGGTGVGLDLDELINVFRFSRNRRLASFQQRLITEEQDKFIDHRFSPLLVRKITHLSGTDLETFMARYRPSFQFAQTSTDYDFDEYIKLASIEYKQNRNRPVRLQNRDKKPF